MTMTTPKTTAVVATTVLFTVVLPLIAVMAHVATMTTTTCTTTKRNERLLNDNTTASTSTIPPMTMIQAVVAMVLYVGYILLACILVWNPRAMKEAADRLSLKHCQQQPQPRQQLPSSSTCVQNVVERNKPRSKSSSTETGEQQHDKEDMLQTRTATSSLLVLPYDDDAYYVMFVRQFGAYLLFVSYALYLHPSTLSGEVWKLMSACIVIKWWHLFQPRQCPIPMPYHVGEMCFLAVIGTCASLYHNRQRQLECS